VSLESAAFCSAKALAIFGFARIFAGFSFPDPTIQFFSAFAIVLASFFSQNTFSNKIPSSEAKSYVRNRALATCSRARRNLHWGVSAKGPAIEFSLQVIDYIRHYSGRCP
jgi:hypothetical protein